MGDEQQAAGTSTLRPVPGRWRLLLGRAAELATIGVGVPTIGALGAAHAWPLELFSHFRVQYSIALVVSAGVFLVLRQLRWCAAATGLLCVNGWWIAPFLLPSGATVAQRIDAGAPSFKLASINVYSGNPTPERVIEFIHETNPDVIVVLEVTPEWEHRLEALSATHPYDAVQSRAGNFGIALYSRWPMDSVEFVPLSENNDAISARIVVDGEPCHVVAAHPFPPAGGRGSELRNRQLRQLAALAQQSDGATIVAGDLNITPFSPYFDEFLAAANLNDPRRGQGLMPTWPSRRLPLWIPIDHCLVSDGIAAKLSVGPDVGSDHRPLLAELQVTHPNSAH